MTTLAKLYVDSNESGGKVDTLCSSCVMESQILIKRVTVRHVSMVNFTILDFNGQTSQLPLFER